MKKQLNFDKLLAPPDSSLSREAVTATWPLRVAAPAAGLALIAAVAWFGTPLLLDRTEQTATTGKGGGGQPPAPAPSPAPKPTPPPVAGSSAGRTTPSAVGGARKERLVIVYRSAPQPDVSSIPIYRPPALNPLLLPFLLPIMILTELMIPHDPSAPQGCGFGPR